jgi:cytochrome P450
VPVIHLPAPSPLEADVSLADHTDVLDWPFARTEDGDPPPILAELRNAPPCVVRLPAGAAESRLAWLVTRYADVRQALGDPRLSADERLPGAPVRIQVPPGGNPSSFLRLDDPEHARLRRMIQTEFTARRVKRLREPVQRLVDELLDELEALPRPADLHASHGCWAFRRTTPRSSSRRPASPSPRRTRRSPWPPSRRCPSTWPNWRCASWRALVTT